MICIERQLVGARSLLALNFLTVLDAFTRDIASISDKPAPLDILVRGKVMEWEPHYMIAYDDGRRDLVMVRTVSWLLGETDEHADYKRDLVDAMTQAARLAGFGFRLVTDEQVYVQPRLANARMLRRHLPSFGTPDGHVAALEALSEMPEETSVHALQERIGKRFDAFVLAIQLDWLGHIRMDRRTLFSRKSSLVKI